MPIVRGSGADDKPDGTSSVSREQKQYGQNAKPLPSDVSESRDNKDRTRFGLRQRGGIHGITRRRWAIVVRLARARQLAEPVAVNEQIERGFEFVFSQAVSVETLLNVACARFRLLVARESDENLAGELSGNDSVAKAVTVWKELSGNKKPLDSSDRCRSPNRDRIYPSAHTRRGDPNRLHRPESQRPRRPGRVLRIPPLATFRGAARGGAPACA